jgi:spore coat protein A
LDLTEDDCATQGGYWLGSASNCGTTMCDVTLTPFVDPLPIPAVATPITGTSGGAAHYEIAWTQFDQQLHRDLPPTTVWGYGGTFPGPTIEAASGQTVTVNWVNDLRDSIGALRTDHYLPVDLCAHGAADVAKGVVHLHGSHCEADSDGYPEDDYLPGNSLLYTYENFQLPATLWYHDHGLGITRLNVYMGLAGLYIIRDPFELALNLPQGEFEVPLVIQDRTFLPDGKLDYPASLQDHFFGEHILVNGKVTPFHEVKQGKYRFRVLNGSGSRALTLALSNGATFHQIGTDGGLVEMPVAMTELTLTPAERADLIIDFSSYAPGTELILTNSAPAPFPGNPGAGVVPNVMKFIVLGQAGDTDPIPVFLRPLDVLQESDALEHRDFVLQRSVDACAGFIWKVNGLGWNNITEYPVLESTEVWSFVNRSGVSHPMHMHLVMFQILDRQAFQIVDDEVVPIGSPFPPEPNEVGWKDTIESRPFEITRVIARFEDYKGKFPYHCHILEHEDYDMMRQFEVVDYAPYCSGDGTAGVDCPCGNVGLPGHGCEVAQGTGGVQLDASSFTPDFMGGGSITLSGTSFPPAHFPTVVGIRSPNRAVPPVVFGDGLLCMQAPVVRFGATNSAGGVATLPTGHGAGPGLFHYQLWFRNIPIAFCDPTAGFNLSNGLTVSWP